MSKAKQQRIQRRVLNKTLDFFRGISGRRLAGRSHGRGLSRDQINEHSTRVLMDDPVD
ncbi:hypothetical protein [Mesorhizobium sp. STM 4661]|uniref:hypothetical protein n=1 Tax=Mesorhizobium sp. STM 4661 TaxID=1297570 RepID=UPI0012F72746|nr:hypothetical protein [Mesorhizobium sp. STM 4661]